MNPFEHHHASAPHADEPAGAETFDPAQQSLADALGVSFLLLKFVMFVALVAYAFSGMFTVDAQEVAVRLRFGRIVGRSAADKVITRGLHFALPYPFEQNKKIDITNRQIRLATQFFFEIPESQQGQTYDQMRPRPLNPEKDGSLLTGDANIMHARWTVVYQIRHAAGQAVDPSAVIRFMRHVGDFDQADRIVRNAAEQGIVHAIARATADDVIKAQNYREAAIRCAQQALDELDSGLKIVSIAIDEATAPLSVRKDFAAVINAENEKAQSIQKAQQQRATTLGATAGEAHGVLWRMIRDFELAREQGDAGRAEALLADIDTALDALNTGPKYGNVPIGGEVAGVINGAKAYRTQIVEQVRAEANQFDSLLTEYHRNPRIVLNRLWQSAREKILTGDIETIYLPGDAEVWIDMNRDPQLQKKRELEQIEAEETPTP